MTVTLPRPRVLGAAFLGAVALLLGARTASAENIVYAPSGAAEAIHDAGVTTALRQAPFIEVNSPRWPVERRLGKVSGSALAKMSADEMVNALRAGWQRDGTGQPVGGRVAVDEIKPVDWDGAASGRLNQALKALGPDAGRVYFYLAPALVEQVGRVDPRAALPTAPNNLRGLVGALQRGGKLYLELYRGTLEPYPLREMANHLTRWEARWPKDRAGDLRVLFGPGGAVSQEEIWNRVRSTPAGRRIAANGAGYYATNARGTAADGSAWARQLLAFLRDPQASPPGGDVRVILGGGLAVPRPTAPLRPGGTLNFTTNRPGNAVVRLISSAGVARVIIGRLRVGPSGAATIPLPPDIRPGAYRIVISFQGEGLRDRTVVPVRVGPRPPAAAPRPRPGQPRLPRGARERLIQSQTIAANAVRLLNAIQEWLDAGITTGDLASHGFGAAFARDGSQGPLAATLRFQPGGPNAGEALAARPITPAPPRGTPGRVRVTPAQLLINQRIAAAAVARANALDARLSAGLTGGDLLPGQLTPGKLAPDVGIAVLGDEPRPAASSVAPKPIPRGSVRGLRVTGAQLDINLRISLAAFNRSKAISERLTSGLDEGDFRAGSIVRANLAPALGG